MASRNDRSSERIGRLRADIPAKDRTERAERRGGSDVLTLAAGLRRYPPGVDDKLAVLRDVPLFADLDDRSLQAVAVLAREVTRKAGDVLMLEGEPGDEFYVILEGTIRIEKGERTIRSMTAGGFLGEIALVDRRPRTATATCVSDVRLLEIRSHEFERLLETLPAVHRRVQQAIERRARSQPSL